MAVMKRLFVLIFIFLTLSGCSISKNTTELNNEIISRYPWNDKLRTEKTEEYTSNDTNIEMNVKLLSVNNEYQPLNRSICFNGEPLHFVFDIIYDAKIPSSITVTAAINGISQPFRLEGETENLTHCTFQVDEQKVIRPGFIIDDPVQPSSESIGYLTFHFMANYDYKYTAPSDVIITSAVSAFGSYFLSSSEYTQAHTPDASLFAFSDNLEHQWLQSELFSDETEDVSAGFVSSRFQKNYDRDELELYLPLNQDETLYAILSGSVGNYRTVIYSEGDIVSLYNGKSYLDWSGQGPDNQLVIPLDLSNLADSMCNLYMVTYNLDQMDQEQEIWIGDLIFISPHVTIVCP